MYSHYEKIAKEAMFNNHDITKEIVEAFYRFKQKEYRTEDVKMHADDLYNEGLLTYSEFVYVNDPLRQFSCRALSYQVSGLFLG